MPLFQQPGEDDFDILVAESRFIGDIQVAIETALDDRKMTQTDLARLLDVSPARVSQILGGNGANLTARTVARVAHVIGLRACLNFSDPSLEGWCEETPEDEEPNVEFGDWVRLACETLEKQGIEPAAPSNDSWTGSPGPDAGAQDEAEQAVAA